MHKALLHQSTGFPLVTVADMVEYEYGAFQFPIRPIPFPIPAGNGKVELQNMKYLWKNDGGDDYDYDEMIERLDTDGYVMLRSFFEFEDVFDTVGVPLMT